MMRRVRQAGRGEGGHTLVELMVALLVGTITMLGAFMVLDTTLDRSREVQERVDALQRGRPAMDHMTRALRSQVCLGVLPAVATASPTEVVIHTDLSDGSRPVQREAFTYDAGRREIVHTVSPGVGTFPNLTFPQVTRRNVLLADVTVEGQPLFRYYAFDTATPPRPDLELTGSPLSAADRARVARIEVQYVARPRNTGARPVRPRASVRLRDQVFVRSADPNSNTPSPTCA